MKRSIVGLVALVALISGPAFADTSVGNNVNLPGFNLQYDANTLTSTNTTFFSAYLNNSDQVTSAYVSVERDTTDNFGWVTMSFSGNITPATTLDSQYQSLSIDRHGVSLSSSASIGSFLDYEGNDQNGLPIFGQTLDNASGNVTLQNVTVLSGTANYNEYSGEGGGKGIVMAAVTDTNQSWLENVQWQVRFNDDSTAALGDSFGNVGVTASAASPVPEPASLGVLCLGVLMLFSRRRCV